MNTSISTKDVASRRRLLQRSSFFSVSFSFLLLFPVTSQRTNAGVIISGSTVGVTTNFSNGYADEAGVIAEDDGGLPLAGVLYNGHIFTVSADGNYTVELAVRSKLGHQPEIDTYLHIYNSDTFDDTDATSGWIASNDDAAAGLFTVIDPSAIDSPYGGSRLASVGLFSGVNYLAVASSLDNEAEWENHFDYELGISTQISGGGEASFDAAAVPEPATFAFLGLGSLGFGAMAYRRRKKQASNNTKEQFATSPDYDLAVKDA